MEINGSQSMAMLRIGDKAPAFKAVTTQGNINRKIAKDKVLSTILNK